jgi:hypothetical protein
VRALARTHCCWTARRRDPRLRGGRDVTAVSRGLPRPSRAEEAGGCGALLHEGSARPVRPPWGRRPPPGGERERRGREPEPPRVVSSPPDPAKPVRRALAWPRTTAPVTARAEGGSAGGLVEGRIVAYLERGGRTRPHGRRPADLRLSPGRETRCTPGGSAAHGRTHRRGARGGGTTVRGALLEAGSAHAKGLRLRVPEGDVVFAPPGPARRARGRAADAGRTALGDWTAHAGGRRRSRSCPAASTCSHGWRAGGPSPPPAHGGHPGGYGDGGRRPAALAIGSSGWSSARRVDRARPRLGMVTWWPPSREGDSCHLARHPRPTGPGPGARHPRHRSDRPSGGRSSTSAP